MKMKKTILSKKDLEVLERIIARYAYIVSFEEMQALFKEYSYDELNQRIKFLINRGWLIRVKRGFYAVANLESHSFSNVSPLVVSQIFVPNSYVSFEFALSHHGFFDQLPKRITTVTSLKSKTYQFQNLDYKFVKAKPEMMTGFIELSIEGQRARVAEIEKALLDFLHFRKDTYTIDLVIEKLKEVKNEIDPRKLAKYARLYPVTIQRRFGFLLDLVSIQSEELYNRLKKTPGFAKLTRSSNIFNAKWRIYYEDRFAK